MDKVYITKSKLKEILGEVHNDYPKPLLSILTAFTLFIIMLLVLVAVVVVFLAVPIYMLVFWIDVLIGKYILKRIFKL